MSSKRQAIIILCLCAIFISTGIGRGIYICLREIFPGKQAMTNCYANGESSNNNSPPKQVGYLLANGNTVFIRKNDDKDDPVPRGSIACQYGYTTHIGSMVYRYIAEHFDLTADSQLPPDSGDGGYKFNVTAWIDAEDSVFIHLYDRPFCRLKRDWEFRHVRLGNLAQEGSTFHCSNSLGKGVWHGEDALRAATILWLKETKFQEDRLEQLRGMENPAYDALRKAKERFKEIDLPYATKRGYGEKKEEK